MRTYHFLAILSTGLLIIGLCGSAFALTTTGFPFYEDFETGVLEDHWESFSSGEGRIRVSSDEEPNGGDYHVLLDNGAEGTYSRNQIALRINLNGRKNVELAFWHKSYNDVWHPMPEVFTHSFDADGVAVSPDGITWYRAVDSLNGPSGEYVQYRIDLDAVCEKYGISYNSLFRIRFQQYGDYPIDAAGYGFDDISVRQEEGAVAQYPFYEGFEYGFLADYWSTNSTNAGRIVRHRDYGPKSGNYHVVMDSGEDGTASLNELVLTVDLSNRSDVELEFYRKHFNDTLSTMPDNPFTGSIKADGVAISDDGITWYKAVWNFHGGAGIYKRFTVDLDDLCAQYGLSFTSNFKIKFQQFGVAPVDSGGFAFDDIRLQSSGGRIAPFPFYDGFEGGKLLKFWTTNSTGSGRIRTWPMYGAHNGDYHVLMDSADDTDSLNELILTINTSGRKDVTLGFYNKRFRDEAHPMPDSFTGSVDADGVAISADGEHWFKAIDDLMGESEVYQYYLVDLDPICAANGIEYGSVFYIKFQQYDNGPITDDGCAYDDISIASSEGGWEYTYPGFVQDFERDGLENYVTTKVTGAGRIRVTGDNEPSGSSKHLLMDSSSDGTYSYCEMILMVNLSGLRDVVLEFDHKRFRDEEHHMPEKFGGSYLADGICISPDLGKTWYRVSDALMAPSDIYQHYMIDLDAIMEKHDRLYNQTFLIKFQQYDDYSIDKDGYGFDNIEVHTQGMTVASFPFLDTFDGTESTGFSNYWTTSMTGAGRTDTSTDYEPYGGGGRHMIMDCETDDVLSLNEAILTINLADVEDKSNITLDFYHKRFSGEADPMPPTFTGSVDADGVAVSEDGDTWYTVFDGLDGPDGIYYYYTVDLDQFCVSNGINLTSEFKIKFQQYGDGSITDDGCAFDRVGVHDEGSKVARYPFMDSFEEGELGPYWKKKVEHLGRSEVSDKYNPQGGIYHLVMDARFEDTYALNEIILTIDLEGQSGVWLDFYHKRFGDDPDPMPELFTDSFLCDGVSISDDGVFWYRAVENLDGPDGVYQRYVIDLDEVCTSNGITYNSRFKIKFQQYDNYSIDADPADRDGYVFDNINVRPEAAEFPFTDDFETGFLASCWATSSTGAGRIDVSTNRFPYGGNYHLLMDCDTDGVLSLNEAVLTIDLEGQSNVYLSFYNKRFRDEAHAMPESFVGSADADGVAISMDGETWYRAYDALMGTSLVYKYYQIDLDTVCSMYGISYSSAFKIKFQQYDNYPIDGDGYGFDDISVYSEDPPEQVVPTIPFTEDFESGYLEDYWSAVSASTGRIRVSPDNGPNGGSYHLLMDCSTDGSYSLNELVLTIDLLGESNVMLGFDHIRFKDEDHAMPDSFTGSSASDGVAISADGETWYKAIDGLMGTSFVYQEYVMDLDEVCTTYGISYNSTFKIKFQQYDNYPIDSDGYGFDNISVYEAEAEPIAGFPFEEDFELGYIESYWSMNSTEAGRIRVSADETPNAGSYHLLMDSGTDGTDSLNELVLTIDMLGQSDVVLGFHHKRFRDEDHPMQDIFTGSDNADGVAISPDGVTWYKAIDCLMGTSYVYTYYEVDLDAVCAMYGISYSSEFRIKFQQYDNYSIDADGCSFDDIELNAVVPEIAVPPFYENFEETPLAGYWSMNSTNAGRIRITPDYGPFAGSSHVVMDSGVDGTFSLNELVLDLNVSGYSDLVLSFYHKRFKDELHSMPASFVGSYDADGIAISVDGGFTWYRAKGDLTGESNVYVYYEVDLDAVCASHGIFYGSSLMIKFQQYDNYPIDGDGYGFDDIRVVAGGERTGVKLFWQNQQSGQVKYWLLNGDGSFNSEVIVGASAGSYGAKADINGDGTTDLLFVDTTTYESMFWILNSNGTIASSGLTGITIPTSIYGGSAGDIDHDGFDDLVIGDASSYDLKYWMLNSDGTVKSTGIVGNPGIGWRLSGLGDIDKDGTVDLILQENNAPNDSYVAYWMLNPDGSMRENGTIREQRTDGQWLVHKVGDIDGDGVADIILRSWIDGTTIYWMLNPDGSRKSRQVIGDPLSYADWHLGAIIDIDANHTGDLIWYNRNTGEVVYWILNANGQFVRSGSIGTEPDLQYRLLEAGR